MSQAPQTPMLKLDSRMVDGDAQSSEVLLSTLRLEAQLHLLLCEVHLKQLSDSGSAACCGLTCVTFMNKVAVDPNTTEAKTAEITCRFRPALILDQFVSASLCLPRPHQHCQTSADGKKKAGR